MPKCKTRGTDSVEGEIFFWWVIGDDIHDDDAVDDDDIGDNGCVEVKLTGAKWKGQRVGERVHVRETMTSYYPFYQDWWHQSW